MKPLFCLSLVVCLHTGVLRADDEPLKTPEPWVWKNVKASGFVDTYFGANFNRPGNQYNATRNFDVDAFRPALGMARFSLESDPAPIGFRFDLTGGRTPQIFHASEPRSVNRWSQAFTQAYVSLTVPKTSGVRVDFGKFYTAAGAELTEGWTNWNYSRSYLFCYGPYFHAGVRGSKSFKSGWTVGGQFVNGWNDIRFGEGVATAGLTGGYSNSKFTLLQTYYGGGSRNFSDTVFLLNATPRLSVSANYDYGRDGEAWQGVSVAGRYAINRRFAVAARGEVFQDKYGLATGVGQTLSEGTLTGEFRQSNSMMWRFEFRRDHSNSPVFFRRGLNADALNQNTLTVGMLWTVGRDFLKF